MPLVDLLELIVVNNKEKKKVEMTINILFSLRKLKLKTLFH